MTHMTKVEVLRAACCLAAIDGEIDQKEQALIEQLADKAGVGKASLEAIVNRAKSDDCFFQEQLEVLMGQPQQTMMVMFNVAMADGAITSEARIVLHHFAQKLKIDDSAFDSLLSSAEQHLENQ